VVFCFAVFALRNGDRFVPVREILRVLPWAFVVVVMQSAPNVESITGSGDPRIPALPGFFTGQEPVSCMSMDPFPQYLEKHTTNKKSMPHPNTMTRAGVTCPAIPAVVCVQTS
jgi:hypothetical protein